jgi:hypothetical protein
VLSLWLSADTAALALLGPLTLVALGECDLRAFRDGSAMPFQLVAVGVAVHHAILVLAHLVGGAVLGTSTPYVAAAMSLFLADPSRADFGPLTRGERVLRTVTGLVRGGFEVLVLRGRWHRAGWSVLPACLAAAAVAAAHRPTPALALLSSAVGLTLALAPWRAFLLAHRASSALIRQRAKDEMHALLAALARDIDALSLDALLTQLGRFIAVVEAMDEDERRLFAPEEAAVGALHRLSFRAHMAAKAIRDVRAALASGLDIAAPEPTAAFDAGMSVAREFTGLRRVLRIPADVAHAAALDLAYWHAWSAGDQDAWYRAKARVLARRTLVNPVVGGAAQMLQDMCDPLANWREGGGSGGRERWSPLLGIIL